MLLCALFEFKSCDGHGSRTSLDLNALSSKVIEPITINLDRGDHGWDLFNGADKRLRHLADTTDREARHGIGPRDLTVVIEGRGRRSKDDFSGITLGKIAHIAKESCCASHAKHKHTGCTGIKRACMTDATCRKAPPRPRHDIV